MKILKIFIFSAALIVAAEGCAQKKTAAIPEGVTKAQVDSLSYALGVLTSENFKQMQLEFIDFDVFKKGIQDALSGDEKALRFDMMAANNYFQQFMMKSQERMMAEREKAAVKNMEDGKKFLEENKAKEGITVTESGLQYKITNPGNNVKPVAEDMVEVNYRGTTIDGKEFDSSYKRNETAKFPLNGVIKGWTEGLQLIGEGGKITLYLPSELAYGERGAGSDIGPNSVLVFEVELIKVNPSTEEK